MPRWTRWFVVHASGRVSEPEIKFIFLILFTLGGLATQANSEAVLPAYLVGLAVAGVFVRDRVLVHRMRATAFSLLTPFYFIKAGLFVQLPAVVSGAGLIVALLAVKVGAKVVGVWPTSRAFGMPVREANYMTLLMSTGLTFGTISALFGLTNGLIDQAAYTVLVTVVILSAVVPTLIATTFFEPRVAGDIEAEEIDAAEGIDAGPLRRPRTSTELELRSTDPSAAADGVVRAERAATPPPIADGHSSQRESRGGA
jgi:Kef-type K+ transport system membrane component KefB